MQTGRRQEGIFYSARTFVGKLTSGLGIFIGGIAVDIINWPTGVKPGDYINPDTLFSLGIIDGPIAAIPSLFAIYFYGKYRISKQQHGEIRRQLIAIENAQVEIKTQQH